MKASLFFIEIIFDKNNLIFYKMAVGRPRLWFDLIFPYTMCCSQKNHKVICIQRNAVGWTLAHDSLFERKINGIFAP